MTWGEELRRPTNIIAIVVGIFGVLVGTVIAIYFYYKGQLAGEITMRVDQVQVFDKTRLGAAPA